jgi:hypothetical protein
MKDLSDIVDAPIHESQNDYHFSEGGYFSLQFKILAITFLLTGIPLLITLNLGGLFLVMIALIILFAKKELSVSFSLAKYRYTFSLFQLKIGSWQSFPNFESISIFNAKKSQGMSAGSQSGTAVFSELEVNLVYNRSRRLTIYTTQKFDKALSVANIFAEKLDLRIYDASTRDGHWIN